MNYGEILKKTWKIIWKHKILWLFGLLAGCGASASGVGGGGSSGMEAFGLIPQVAWSLMAGIFFFVGIFMAILFLFVRTAGKIGVIKGTQMADEAEPDESTLSLRIIFDALKPYFWKVLLFDLGFGVAAYVVVLFFLPNLIYLTIGTFGLSLLLFAAAGWLLGAVVQFTTIAIVDEDLEVIDAVKRAWQVVRHNLGRVIVLSLILGIGQSVIGMVLTLPLLLVPLPLLINLIVTGFDGFVVGLVLSIMLLMVILPLIIFLSIMLTTYVLSCWTVAYRRLKNKTDSKLLELPQEQDDDNPE